MVSPNRLGAADRPQVWSSCGVPLLAAHGPLADARPTLARTTFSPLKGANMAQLTQEGCDAIAAKLNSRPRQRLGFKTPEECYALG